MADRLASLRRIAKVQAEMVRLAEWRVAVADRQIADIGQDRARLADYVGGAGALGVPLAQAALRSMHALGRRTAEIERGRAAETARLDELSRRGKAVAGRLAEAEDSARREAEKAALREVVEVWLAREEPSLRAERSDPRAEEQLRDGDLPPLGCFVSGW